MFLFAILIPSLLAATKSYPPHPTAKSGVPNTATCVCTCVFAILFIAISVSILCMCKTTDNEAFGSRQILLSTPDI